MSQPVINVALLPIRVRKQSQSNGDEPGKGLLRQDKTTALESFLQGPFDETV